MSAPDQSTFSTHTGNVQNSFISVGEWAIMVQLKYASKNWRRTTQKNSMTCFIFIKFKQNVMASFACKDNMEMLNT